MPDDEAGDLLGPIPDGLVLEDEIGVAHGPLDKADDVVGIQLGVFFRDIAYDNIVSIEENHGWREPLAFRIGDDDGFPVFVNAGDG